MHKKYLNLNSLSQSLSQGLLCSSLPTSKQTGVGKRLGGYIADPAWAKRYSIPDNVILSNKSWGVKFLEYLLLGGWLGSGRWWVTALTSLVHLFVWCGGALFSPFFSYFLFFIIFFLTPIPFGY